MVVPEDIRANAYRVLGASASAHIDEVHRCAESMMRAAKLGLDATSSLDIPGLGDMPRSESDVRSALGTLGNPSQRLRSRVFWLHHLSEESGSSPGADAEIERRHDGLLRRLIALHVQRLDGVSLNEWREVLLAFHELISSDAYWKRLLEIDKEGRHEPSARLSDIEAVRRDLVPIAASALIAVARDAVERGEAGYVKPIFSTLDALHRTGVWAAELQEELASKAVSGLEAACRETRLEYGSRVIREERAAKANAAACEAELQHFRSSVKPALRDLIALVGEDHQIAMRCREQAAECLGGIGADFTWAEEFEKAQGLYEEAARVGEGTLVAPRIQEALPRVRVSARQQRVFGRLEPIDAAPSLRTVNGFGTTMYGHSDFDQETNSYLANLYFVALGVPLFPLGRYRVISNGNQYRFLGRLPLRKGDWWHVAITTTLIVGLFIAGGISSDSRTSYSSRPSSYGGSSTSPPTRAATMARTENDIFEGTRRSGLKLKLENGRKQIAQLEAELKPAFDEMKTLDARIKALDGELSMLKMQHSAGVDIDVDSYNRDVDSYNKLIAKRKKLVNSKKSAFTRYEQLLKEDDSLVGQYNALLH
jgi:hypothetical protein